MLQIEETNSNPQNQLLIRMVPLKKIRQGAYELQSSNDEIKRITFDEDHFTEDYPFTIKPNFSTLRSIGEISR